MEFGDWLTERMRSRRMSARAMAIYMGVTHNTVLMWSRGIFRPKFEYCQKIADVLRVPISDVYSATGYEVAPRSLKESPETYQGVPISQEVEDLLRLYHRADERGRRFVRETAQVAADMAVEDDATG